MKVKRTIFVASMAAILMGVTSFPASSQLFMSRAQLQERADTECEEALASGDLVALENVRRKYWNFTTACTALASTVPFSVGQGGDGVVPTRGGDNVVPTVPTVPTEPTKPSGQNAGNNKEVGNSKFGGEKGEEPSSKDKGGQGGKDKGGQGGKDKGGQGGGKGGGQGGGQGGDQDGDQDD